MSTWAAYVMSVGLLFLAVTMGFSLAQAQSAQSSLSQIAAVAAQEMSIEGGYTSQVQNDIINGLQQNGFNPQLASVQVSPSGVRVSYGQTMSLTLAYPFPVRIVYISPFQVALSVTAQAVSMYVPGSAASSDPIIVPGQGTSDLHGTVTTTTGTWQGP